MELTLENITKTLETLEPDEYREAAIAISVLMVPRERKRWAVYCARQAVNGSDRRLRAMLDAVDEDTADILTDEIKWNFEDAHRERINFKYGIDEETQKEAYAAESVKVAKDVNQDSDPDYAAGACMTADAASGHVLYPSLLRKGAEIAKRGERV